MSCLCFLCEADISYGMASVKRKKLLGSATSKYIKTMDDMGFEVFGRRLADLTDVGAEYICIGCCDSVDN